MKLLIQFPTRERPEKFFKYLDKYIDLLGDKDNYGIHVSCDADDLTMNNISIINRINAYENVFITFADNKSKIEAINAGVSELDWDILLLASDDMLPVSLEYDLTIREAMFEHFPTLDGILHYNDGYKAETLNTLVIMGRKYYGRFNYIYNPIYKSFYCDNEFDLISNLLKKKVYLDEIIIKHEHPGNVKKGWDALYAKNHTSLKEDKEMFEKRKKDIKICKLKDFQLCQADVIVNASSVDGHDCFSNKLPIGIQFTQADVIVNASSVDGHSVWQDVFPIGLAYWFVNKGKKLKRAEKKKLVLTAFAIETDRPRKKDKINRKSIESTLKQAGFYNIHLSFDGYFDLLPQYKFVISPIGNGIDCHRYYETWITGGIPIMEDNEKLRKKYEGLPVLWTKDYSEITREYLEEQYKLFENEYFDYSKLFLNHYTEEEQKEIKTRSNYWIEKRIGINKYYEI